MFDKLFNTAIREFFDVELLLLPIVRSPVLDGLAMLAECHKNDIHSMKTNSN